VCSKTDIEASLIYHTVLEENKKIQKMKNLGGNSSSRETMESVLEEEKESKVAKIYICRSASCDIFEHGRYFLYVLTVYTFTMNDA